MADQIDRSPGQVNMLSKALGRLADQIQDQGAGLGQSIYRASQLNAETAERIASASAEHAKSLSRATWALVGATIVLVLVTAINVYVVAKAVGQEDTPPAPRSLQQ